MTNTSSICKKYFEDFDKDFSCRYTVPGLTINEIIQFASQYDPQRFHLDEDAAAKTHFGSLVASGFQTQLLCFKPFCIEVLQSAAAVGAPGIDSIKWLRPWYPEKPLEVEVKLVNKRLSSKRNDRGYIAFKLEATASEGLAMTMEWSVIILTRNDILLTS